MHHVLFWLGDSVPDLTGRASGAGEFKGPTLIGGRVRGKLKGEEKELKGKGGKGMGRTKGKEREER